MPHAGYDNPASGPAAMTVLHYSSGFPPLLRELKSESIMFVVGSLDGSSMKLESLKAYLSDTLFAMSSRTYCMFNIISFSSESTKWCSRSVRFSPENVSEAVSWIKTLPFDSGGDIESALTAAYQDPACQALVLIIDTLPNHMLQGICGHASHYGKGRPMHILYLTPGDADRSNTLPTFQMVSLISAEPSFEVPSCQRSCCVPQYSAPEIPPCPSHGMTYHEAHAPLCELPVSHNASLADALMRRDFMNMSTETMWLVRGARVLARRATDGYYYLAHIAQEVEGSSGFFLLEFEKSRKLKRKPQLRMQETALYDIIHYEDVHRQPLAPGDRVLAPLDVLGERYGPGKVLQGSESRGFSSDMQNSGVLVTFWNGQTRQIPPGIAVRIPIPLSDRIILEYQMPPSARQKLVECSPGYPCTVPPGYRSSGGCVQPACAQDVPWTQPCGPPNLTQSCQACPTVWSQLSTESDSVTRSNSPAGKVNRKDEKLNSGKSTSSGGTMGKEKKKKKLRKEASRDRQADNCPKMSRSEREIGSVMRSNAAGSLETIPRRQDIPNSTERPPHAYGFYGQSSLDLPDNHLLQQNNDHSEVSSLQAVLNQIDRSLKTDRLLMEASLPRRRPQSAPSTQRCVWKTPKPEELRKKAEAVKAEEWRRQEAQRQVQKERELEMREQLLQQFEHEIREKLQEAAQRQKSLPRTQHSEKQDQRRERTSQPARPQSSLKIFRNKTAKESSEHEENEDQAGRSRPKVQYLKTQQRSMDEPDNQYNKRNQAQDPAKTETLRKRSQSLPRRSHSEPKEPDRDKNQRHSSKHNDTNGSIHFYPGMEQDYNTQRGRRPNPQPRFESRPKEIDREQNLHHYSMHKDTRGSVNVSQGIEQAKDILRSRQQSPQLRLELEAENWERGQNLLHSTKHNTAQGRTNLSQEMEQKNNTLRSRSQSLQRGYNSPNEQHRDQTLRRSLKNLSTQGSWHVSQESEPERDMPRSRRQSPQHKLIYDTKELEREQTQRHSSRHNTTLGRGYASQETEQDNDVLRSRWQNQPQRFQPEHQDMHREQNLLSLLKA